MCDHFRDLPPNLGRERSQRLELCTESLTTREPIAGAKSPFFLWDPALPPRLASGLLHYWSLKELWAPWALQPDLPIANWQLALYTNWASSPLQETGR